MKKPDSDVDYVSAPRDYADFYSKYRSYVVSLVRRSGIEPQYAEDVASDIMLRFMERDFLAEFDPTLTFTYKGEERPARFRSFLSKIVITYARGLRDKQHRIRAREMHIFDFRKEDNNEWLDVFGRSPSADVDVVDELAEKQLVDQLRTYLATVPKRSRHDACDLVAFFDAVVDQIRRDGTWNSTELRRIFGVGTTAIYSWMWWLRQNLAAALNQPMPVKRVRAAPSCGPR